MRTSRILASAVAVGGLYAVGAILSYRYLSVPASGASFFPAAGLTLAVLLSTPRRLWPYWLAAVAIAEIVVDLEYNHLSVFMALGFAIANVVEPLVGATLVGTVSRRRHAQPRQFLFWYVVCAVVAGPFVGGLIGGIVTTISNGRGLASTAAEWWLGDALGVLVIATPILAWRRRDFYDIAASFYEVSALVVAAFAVTIAPALYSHESFAYLALPVLMLAALRGGPFAVGVAGVGVAVGSSWTVASGHAARLIAVRGPEGALIDTQWFIAVTLLAALTLAVTVGERARMERRLRRHEIDRVRADLAAMQAAVTERRRIARETHDIVGHALNVIILSAAGARRVLERNPRQARELLATLEDVGRDAFRDLDVALGLTDQSPEYAPLKGIADLDELVRRLVQAGMHVEYIVEGPARPLPRLVDGSAYRIVQESLTNVARHAVDAHTQVHVRFASNTLFLTVSDQGRAVNKPTAGGGRGLTGMRERVAVLGGRLVAGPIGDNGYAVIAELPLEQV